MALEEGCCCICESDRSTKKNPIIFCDGEGCNIPVHRECYGVDTIPDGAWYCQKCENKRRNKPVRTRCCPLSSGAFKLTTKAGEYVHVVCAKWNKAIDHTLEPYDVTRTQLDSHECVICARKDGMTIPCEVPSCSSYFHVTCGIKDGLISVAKTVPTDYSPRCKTHQSRPLRTKRSGSTAIMSITSSSTTSSPMVKEGEDPSEGEENYNRGLTVQTIRNKKRREGPSGSVWSDEGEDDDSDDQMGTASAQQPEEDVQMRPPLTTVRSYRDHFEAKRRKSEMERARLTQTVKIPSPPVSSGQQLPQTQSPPVITSPSSPHIPQKQPQKQKLPNRAHLGSTNSQQQHRNDAPPLKHPIVNNEQDRRRHTPLSSIPPSSMPRKPTDSATINDTMVTEAQALAIKTKMAELRDEIFLQNRWDAERRLKRINREIESFKSENWRLQEFKRKATDVFLGLNIRPSDGRPVTRNNVEDFISELQLLLTRTGVDSIPKHDMQLITEQAEDMARNHQYIRSSSSRHYSL
ncbi:hypothetical protein BX666DRAFT_1913904 [Dichotomocladium elegans]|nr:hypothetical protein BX666DRAFT_1913904 [Dichotomocladium elegans]